MVSEEKSIAGRTAKALQQSRSIQQKSISCERERRSFNQHRANFIIKERLLQTQKNSLIDTIKNYSRNRKRVDNIQIQKKYQRYKVLERGFLQQMEDCKQEVKNLKRINSNLKKMKGMKINIKQIKPIKPSKPSKPSNPRNPSNPSKETEKSNDITTSITLPDLPEDDWEETDTVQITSGLGVVEKLKELDTDIKKPKELDDAIKDTTKVIKNSEESLNIIIRNKDTEIKTLKRKLKKASKQNKRPNLSKYRKFSPKRMQSKGKIYFFNPKTRRPYRLTLKYEDDEFKIGPKGRIYSVTHGKFVNPIKTDKPRGATNRLLNFLEDEERKITGRPKFGTDGVEIQNKETWELLKRIREGLVLIKNKQQKAKETKDRLTEAAKEKKRSEAMVIESGLGSMASGTSSRGDIELTSAYKSAQAAVKSGDALEAREAAEGLNRSLLAYRKDLDKDNKIKTKAIRSNIDNIGKFMDGLKELETKSQNMIGDMSNKFTSATARIDTINKLVGKIDTKLEDMNEVLTKADDLTKSLEGVGNVYDKINETWNKLNKIGQTESSETILSKKNGYATKTSSGDIQEVLGGES